MTDDEIVAGIYEGLENAFVVDGINMANMLREIERRMGDRNIIESRKADIMEKEYLLKLEVAGL